MNRLSKFYSGHLSRQIVISGLVSISNFCILYFASKLFTSITEASEFLALYSFAIILSSYFSYTSLFRNGVANKLVIDLSFYGLALVMILVATIHNADRWMLSVLIVALMFTKDIYRFVGINNSKQNNFGIRWSVLVLSLVVLVFMVDYYFTIKPINTLILSSIFTLQLGSVFLFKLDGDSVQFSKKPINSINLTFSAAAEIMPIMAGYFVNVYTINIMMADEYVDYRRSFAIIGISSLIGSISLVVFSTGRIVLANYLVHLSVLLFISMLVSFYFQDSLNIMIVTTLLVFSVSAAINSYNKINLAKMQYFLLTSVPAIAITTYILISTHLTPVRLLLVLSTVQVFYCIISHAIIRSKATSR